MRLIIFILLLWLVMYFLRNKVPSFKKLGAYFLAPAVLAAPVVFMIVIFGLSGSDKENFVLIGIGYICILVFSFISLRKSAVISGAILGLLVLAFGFYKDADFWKKHNQDLCNQLRADPLCIESKAEFHCDSNSSVGGFSSANLCSVKYTDKELDLINLDKRNRQIQIAKRLGQVPSAKLPNMDYIYRARNAFKKIVKDIISSKNPGDLNFEDQLKAIYNCINREFEDTSKAERYATMDLVDLIKTPEEVLKYRAYLASKGRIVNKNLNVAALPAGDKKFDCSYLKGVEP